MRNDTDGRRTRRSGDGRTGVNGGRGCRMRGERANERIGPVLGGPQRRRARTVARGGAKYLVCISYRPANQPTFGWISTTERVVQRHSHAPTKPAPLPPRALSHRRRPRHSQLLLQRANSPRSRPSAGAKSSDDFFGGVVHSTARGEENRRGPTVRHALAQSLATPQRRRSVNGNQAKSKQVSSAADSRIQSASNGCKVNTSRPLVDIALLLLDDADLAEKVFYVLSLITGQLDDLSVLGVFDDGAVAVVLL
uniref:Uncharacterized protein n=1 Tax=Plectus sambesii TaxID=2011161 RepID=A0A914VGL1_9BILA